MTDRPTAPAKSAAAVFIASAEAAGVRYAGARGQGGAYYCPNPSHEDERPSLDVAVSASSGKVIFTCTPCRHAMGQEAYSELLREVGIRWAGKPCKPEDVDWGETAAPAMPRATKDGGGSGGQGSVSLVATYKYLFSDGRPNFMVRRFEGDRGKFFSPVGYDPEAASWSRKGKGALDGVERTPYHLEEFSGWAGGVLYLVEGEKATDALVGAGRAATTFHGGADGKLEPDWVERYGFKRFKVRVWPDADEAGVERARQLVAALVAGGVNADYFGVPASSVNPKDDAYDALERGQQGSARRLLDADLDELAALHPLPRRNRPSEPPKGQGKGIIPAEGWGPQSGENEPPARDDRPYRCSPAGAVYKFTEELIDRHFRDDRGVLTLRFHNRGQAWMWNAEHAKYELLTDEEIEEKVSRLVRDAHVLDKEGNLNPTNLQPKHVAAIVRALRSDTLNSDKAQAGALLPCKGGVPFRNGWLNVETGELEPIGPERDVRWNVPMDYDDEASECPRWEAFLNSLGWVKGSEERRLLQQWYGWLLSGRTDIHKGMLLIGPKRSGKGTILKVAKGMMGDGAVGTQLEKFSERFGMENFIGAGLVMIDDARFGMKTEASVVEKLLSVVADGEMTVDTKYGKVQNLRLGLRLMIATNELPNFVEASDAIASRFLVLNTERSFYGHEDLNLERDLLAELPGIVKWSLEGLHEVVGLGGFSETSSGLATQEQIIRDSAPVRIFVEECCELGPNYKIDNDRLYGEYHTWATQNGMYVLPSNRFGRDLITAFPGQVKNLALRENGRVVRGKLGIRMRRS